MRYEEIILGQICCEEAPQVVPAWRERKKKQNSVFFDLHLTGEVNVRELCVHYWVLMLTFFFISTLLFLYFHLISSFLSVFQDNFFLEGEGAKHCERHPHIGGRGGVGWGGGLFVVVFCCFLYDEWLGWSDTDGEHVIDMFFSCLFVDWCCL